MPQASDRLLATPRINPRLLRSRPPASTMTRLAQRCRDGDRAGSGSTNAILPLTWNAESPRFLHRTRNLRVGLLWHSVPGPSSTAGPACRPREYRESSGVLHHAAMAPRRGSCERILG